VLPPLGDQGARANNATLTLYLGRRYVLKLLDPDEEARTVRLHRGRLEVRTNDRSPDVVRGRVRARYRYRTREYFARRIEAIGKALPWVDKMPPLQLLTMTTQWGSCAADGSVILNPMLIKAPRECIDYVVLHELCHLQEHNHSRQARTCRQHSKEWRANWWVKTTRPGNL
jgi:predicted metal-dependent hydrolase